MCYYNGQKVTHTEFIRLMNLEKMLKEYDFLNKQIQIGFNYGKNAVLKKIEGHQDFEIVEMEWGFIPSYWKNREEVANYRNGFKDTQGRWVQYITLNAMSEELLLPKKMYRDAALQRRCLVLSSGFFEWRHIYPPNKRTGQPTKTAIKYPYHITVKDAPYFYIAGIWQPWVDQSTGEMVNTFSLVTTAANPLMEIIHNSKKRMPTILPDELAFEWMFGDLSEERITELATYQFSAEQMEVCSVAKDFRESIEPAKPHSYEDLPAFELNL